MKFSTLVLSAGVVAAAPLGNARVAEPAGVAVSFARNGYVEN